MLNKINSEKDVETVTSKFIYVHNLKQNEAQSACPESTHKGYNLRLKDVTQTQQQRPMVTLTWHACKYKVHKLHPELSDQPLFRNRKISTA